jgi:peptidoglycan/xylan/chitin deacetylase (PgdA/CDA1 family)
MSYTYTKVLPPDPDSQFEFTEDGFTRILDFAASRYSFARFGSAPQAPSLLWRHDVDMSVNRAAVLARLEEERGVTATYFIRLHAEYYNVFEWPIRAMIQDISARGHEIGLHFEADPDFKLPDEDVLEEKLENERDILEGVIEHPVTAVSFHDPETGDLLRFRREVYAGMANAYAYLGEAGYVYVSDSNGYWRFRSLPDALRENVGHNVHVLTHPEWWTPEPMPPRARMQRCAEGRSAAVQLRYDTLLSEEGRINVR